MKLENQVTSLELSKRLKELGVRQESIYYYYIDQIDVGEYEHRLGVKGQQLWNPLGRGVEERIALFGIDYSYEVVHGIEALNISECISAFTVAEMGELLPFTTAVIKQKYGFQIFGIKENAPLNYTMLGGHGISLPSNISEADARAKMLIYLLENKLIEL